VKKRRKKGVEALKTHAAAGLLQRNPKLAAQTRKVLRAHYAAKYRAR